MGMIGREDLDYVITSLKCCMGSQCNVCQEEEGSGYPDGTYPWFCAKHDMLVNKAIGMLEEIKPRVLTLDEVIASRPGTVVWLEDYNKRDVIAGLLKRVFIYSKVIDFLIANEKVNNEATADLENYSAKWRCWTSHPTDAQRKAVEWNDA